MYIYIKKKDTFFILETDHFHRNCCMADISKIMNGAGNTSRTPLFSSHSTRTKEGLTELYDVFHPVLS